MPRSNSNTELVLSLFPGVGLLDRAFQGEGFCVVKGPDKIWDDDICDFAGIPGRFDGIIAGPPCQGFSVANPFRNDPSHDSVVNSVNCLAETCRVIQECAPAWLLIENVPGVPDVRIDGYTIQRIPISDWECGGVQLRSRHVQFGHREGRILRPKRVNDRSRNRRKGRRPEAVTTKPTSRHRTFAAQCRAQGLPNVLELQGMTRSGKFRAVGNGVPMSIGRALAAAVANCAAPD